jgi:hypothetical protein
MSATTQLKVKTKRPFYGKNKLSWLLQGFVLTWRVCSDIFHAEEAICVVFGCIRNCGGEFQGRMQGVRNYLIESEDKKATLWPKQTLVACPRGCSEWFTLRKQLCGVWMCVKGHVWGGEIGGGLC